MDTGIIMAAASLAGTAVIGIGLIRQWRRNGRDQKARDEAHAVKLALRDRELELGYKAIANRLDDKDTGLSALNDKVSNLSSQITTLNSRVNTIERNP